MLTECPAAETAQVQGYIELRQKGNQEKKEKFRNNLIKGQNLTKEIEKSMILMISILTR